MSRRLIVDEAMVPRLADHVVLRFDARRRSWFLLAPERLYALDDAAHAIVARCRGGMTLAGIVDALSAEFDAPRERILSEACTLLQDLADRGVVTR